MCKKRSLPQTFPVKPTEQGVKKEIVVAKLFSCIPANKKIKTYGNVNQLSFK